MFEKPLLTKLQLACGRQPGAPPQSLELSCLTVFVGPNNSGKSLALREILNFTQPREKQKRRIAITCETTPLTQEEIEYSKQLFETPSRSDDHFKDGQFIYQSRTTRAVMGLGEFSQVLSNPVNHWDRFRELYLGNVMVSLTGDSRITLTNQKPLGDLQRPEMFNSFQALFAKDDLRKQVRSILYRAFKKYFVLDPTAAGHLRITFSDRAPKDATEEQGLHKEARDYYASADLIDSLSDGVKAFTGIIVEVVAGNPRVLLIDEPEAFLHPPLARQLGVELATLAAETRKNVFAATHSADFVMGCLQSGADVDVVRLTYQNGSGTARVLKNDDLVQMMRDPLLRSSGVINALFYDCAVVTESDSDRAFYQEINDRLLRHSVHRGVPNCLFLNAQNKQTTARIVRPLRELGIPVASIVDLDVLKEGGQVWSTYIDSGHLPEIEKQSSALTRANLLTRLKEKCTEFKRSGGLGLLDGKDREAADNLFNRLEEYGLFVVRGGELESWLKPLGATGHSPGWLVDIFEKMGSDPLDSKYLKPKSDDVWAFVDQMRTWLLNPARKGIPD